MEVKGSDLKKEGIEVDEQYLDRTFIVLSKELVDFDYLECLNEDLCGVYAAQFEHKGKHYVVPTDGIADNFGPVVFYEDEDHYYVDGEVLSYAYDADKIVWFEDAYNEIKEGNFKVNLKEEKIYIGDTGITITLDDIAHGTADYVKDAFLMKYACGTKRALKDWYHDHVIKDNLNSYKLATEWHATGEAIVKDDFGNVYRCNVDYDSTGNCYYGGFTIEPVEEADPEEK